MASLFVLALTPEMANPEADPFRRVRTLDAHVSNMLAIGYHRSATFRDLVHTLERSDVIVYVERRALVADAAYIQFATSGGGRRYLRITLDTELSADDGVALLGHELRHAVEVARVPWVDDLATFGELYRAIGHSSCKAPPRRCFDTAAAVDAGRRVRLELLIRQPVSTD